MNARMSLRPSRTLFALACALLCALAVLIPQRALALDGVSSQATTPEASYPADEWVPLSVGVNNLNAERDITVLWGGSASYLMAWSCAGS